MQKYKNNRLGIHYCDIMHTLIRIVMFGQWWPSPTIPDSPYFMSCCVLQEVFPQRFPLVKLSHLNDPTRRVGVYVCQHIFLVFILYFWDFYILQEFCFKT